MRDTTDRGGDPWNDYAPRVARVPGVVRGYLNKTKWARSLLPTTIISNFPTLLWGALEIFSGDDGGKEGYQTLRTARRIALAAYSCSDSQDCMSRSVRLSIPLAKEVKVAHGYALSQSALRL